MSQNEQKTRVAIVGMSYRLPGCGTGALWDALLEGRDAVTSVAPGRWALDSLQHPRRSEPGTSYTFRAGSIGDIAGFDASFFGISPREAAQMDPQQRILLELAWEALENAAIRPSTLRGTDAGVYIGLSSVDYGYRLAYDLAGIDSSTATGGTASIAANRLSYFFDWHGPSMVIDTACSSSLVAFHQACGAVASGDVECAIAGGISLHVHPYGFVAFSKASMLSRSGACRVFDAKGDGYVRSEGGGVFVLKPLDAALRDGNPVLAVVAATAVNSGGRAAALTVPNADAQASLLGRAYERAGISPADIDYLEAHGTGTAVGDPLEARALGMALGTARPRSSPLPIGSVKSNLGHLEAASGVAGLAKAVLCLRHRMIPPTIHVDEPNPAIAFGEWNLEPVTQARALHPSRKLIVGVNSFGFGGANAHAVLESAPTVPTPIAEEATQAAVVVTGHGEAAMRASAAAHADLLQSSHGPSLRDVAYSSAHARDWHSHRAIVVGTDRAQVAGLLAAFGRGENPRAVVSGKALSESRGPAFIYSGNGAAWPGMGSRLMREEPAFAAAIEKVDAILRRESPLQVAAMMREGVSAEELRATEIAQPLLFALQVGVTELLRSRGVQPTDVAGHSVGEVAAAWACGALTLEEATQVVHHRSRLQARAHGLGGMVALGLPQAQAEELIASLPLAAELSIACLNSPRHVTVAGPVAALAALEHAAAGRRVFHRRLDFDYPFHSAAMDPLRDDILASLRGLRPGAAIIPFHSSITGDAIPGSLLNAQYWWRNVREPVRFETALRSIARTRANVLVEIGPQPILRNYMNDCLRAESVDGRVVASLERGRDGAAGIGDCIHHLAVAGCGPSRESVFPIEGRIAALPNYPWQRERHWRESTAEAYDLVDRPREHPLLGHRLKETAFHWENHLDTAAFPLLRDHAVGEAATLPGSAFVEMALAASRFVHGGDSCEVESLDIRAPLQLEETDSRTVRFSLDPADGRFTVRSRARLSSDSWTLHAAGRVCAPGRMEPAGDRFTLPARRPDVTGAEHYELTRRVGLAYGPAFQVVARAWVDDSTRTAVARLVLPDAARSESGAFLLHPASLDGAFQVLVDLLRNEIPAEGAPAFVPVRIERAKLHRIGIAHACRVRIASRGPRSIVADVEIQGTNGELLAELGSVRFRAAFVRTPVAARMRRLVHRAVPRPLEADRAQAPRATLAALSTVLATRLHQLSLDGPRARYYSEVEPLCDVACAAFAERALREVCGDGANVPADIASRVPAARVPLLERLLAILEEDQVLEPGEDGWRWSVVNELPDAHESWFTLVRDYPDEARSLLALGLAGMRLPAVLRGEHDDTASVPFAAPAHGAWQANSGLALGEMARAWLARTPPERPLRILEIASQRSEATSRVVEALEADRFEYVVACASPEVHADYETLADAMPSVEIVTLDAEDLARRGPFDAIVVSGGLEAWPGGEALLARLPQWLAMGGVLAMLCQHPSRMNDLLHGADSAWWGPDAALARRASLLRPADWERRLRALGFDAICAVPEIPGAGRGCFAILAQRDRALEVKAQAHESRSWLILHEGGAERAALAAGVQAHLQERGHAARTAAWQPGSDVPPLADAVVLISGVAPGDRMAPTVADLSLRCHDITQLLEACRERSSPPAAWIVTQGAAAGLLSQPLAGATARNERAPDNAVLWGFARSLANEYPDLEVRRIDCSDDGDHIESIATRLAAELEAAGDEDEVILTREGRYALRLGEAYSRPSPAPHARLDLTGPGSLKSLAWHRIELRAPGAGEVQVEVRAAGLNFRDVMYSMGLLSDEAVETGFAGPTLGMEVAGIVSAVGPGVEGLAVGDEVIAFAPASFATHVVTQASAVAVKPPAWSFEASATVPIAYFTALYALKHLANLREGESVLVHGAAGGVGIAALHLARAMGAKVFATAGTPDKRELVRLLGADHVFDSRGLGFAEAILRETGGRGVDVVLNSLSGEALMRSLQVLKPFGRFLELGKRDFYENTALGLRPFRNNISYFGIDADQLLRERPALAREVFTEMMELVSRGVMGPLPYRAFPASQAVEAFRHMQQSRHVGKVVISLSSGVRAPAARRAGELSHRPDATYLVTGGTSGFGLKTAQWLASHGARNLVIASRGPADSLAARAAIADLEALGARAVAVSCDVSDAAQVDALLARIDSTLPPLRGVVHAAAVIDDGLARNLSPARIASVLAPKVAGARHLDRATRGKALDFFVLYSSATTLFGNPGQSAYVAANCHLEAVASVRRAAGLPATCIAWGAIGDTGYLARNKSIRDTLESHMGGSALPSDVALEALGAAIAGNESGHALLEFGWRSLQRFLPASKSARYRELGSRNDDARADGDRLHELRQLARSLPASELATLVEQALAKELAAILRTPVERLDPRQPLPEMGVDSLMGMELLTAIEAQFGLNLQVMALADAPTLERLVERIVRELRSGDGAEEPRESMTDSMAQVAARYAADLDPRRVAELARELDAGNGERR
ncbi:MAG TPA: SDR family NAD(P)-dependent oxidoreductase [Usitatibacter sp.]|nr:SDR family NAD(P)-dependent oxidoreductase [Usitatibacter sp.]